MAKEFSKWKVSGGIEDTHGRSITNNYTGITIAVSEGKAKSNVMYQAKDAANVSRNANWRWSKNVKVIKIED